MRNPSQILLLEEMLKALVKHFGFQKVQAALSKFSDTYAQNTNETEHKKSSRKPNLPNETIIDDLDSIRETAPEKHQLVSEFYSRLKSREILPDSQDIRYFAQLIGLKHIPIKSRKDTLPTVLRFLLTLSTDRLRTEIQRANSISEEQRQQGFSVLTDKLLGE